MSLEPVRTTTYTLTSADALAWEQAAARMTPLATVALVVWLGLCGSVALLIPPDWAGMRLTWSFGLVVAILLAIGATLALLLQALRQWQAARRRFRRPEEVTLVEWPAHLDVVGPGPPRALAFPAVRAAILTRTHLFLKSESDVVIIPRRAFPEEGTAEELSRRIVSASWPADPAPPLPAPTEPALPVSPPPVPAPAKPEPDLVALAKALEPSPPAPAAAAPEPSAPPKVDPKPPSA